VRPFSDPLKMRPSYPSRTRTAIGLPMRDLRDKREERDSRDERGLEVRSSRFSELRTQNFELCIALSHFSRQSRPSRQFGTLTVYRRCVIPTGLAHRLIGDDS
jgi:hypothetical protein